MGYWSANCKSRCHISPATPSADTLTTYADVLLSLALCVAGVSGHANGKARAYPTTGPINSSMYYANFLINQDWSLEFFQKENLTSYPASSPDVPYVISGSNRGQVSAV